MKTNMQMKSEELSDDDIPFKTLFPNVFKVKVESMKTKGASKTCLNEKSKSKAKAKAKAKDKSNVKSKNQDETNGKSSMVEVNEDEKEDEKKEVEDEVKEEVNNEDEYKEIDVFGEESEDDDTSAFFGK